MYTHLLRLAEFVHSYAVEFAEVENPTTLVQQIFLVSSCGYASICYRTLSFPGQFDMDVI